MATRLATAMIAPRVASTTRVVTAMACGGGSGSVSVAGPRCALRNLRTPFAVRMVVSPAHASTRFGAGRAFTTLHRAPRWGRYAHAVDATGARCLVGRATGAASRQLWRGTVSSVRGLSVRATAPRAMRPTYGQRCGDAGGQRASNGGRQGPDNNAGSTGQNPGGQATGVWAAVVWPFRTVRNWWRHHSARLKNVFKTYGTVAFGTYFGSYFVTLGTLFVLVRNNVIEGPDVAKWLDPQHNRLLRTVTSTPIHVPRIVEDYIVAWLIAKTTEPARVVLTIMAVPAIVRYMPVVWLRRLRVRVSFKRRRAHVTALPPAQRLARKQALPLPVSSYTARPRVATPPEKPPSAQPPPQR